MSDPSNVIEFLHIIENLKVPSEQSKKKKTCRSLCWNVSLTTIPSGFSQRTKRTGWVDHGVKGSESIADHMHRMGVMAMLIDDKSLDISNRERCGRHQCDLLSSFYIVYVLNADDRALTSAASYQGDITPHQNVSKEEKYKLEGVCLYGAHITDQRFALARIIIQNLHLSHQTPSPQDAMESFCTQLGDTPQSREIRDLWYEYEDVSTPEARLVKDLDKFEMIVQAVEYEKSDKKKLEQFFDSTRGRFRHPMVKAWAEALYEERQKYWDNHQIEMQSTI
ncbi:hypothetical protein BC938DRAFT_470589 [Jimgerdemannia flammicorona]|uniref:HD domain-containing protein n=1 Tax=Jimgerdemannia flammicorona TaxID=994334 RepID=A0A433Q9W5_9FUNG|nr:hypothetical protein BC938DRAFT_470589 [Jimgerdemannia flammicorona]